MLNAQERQRVTETAIMQARAMIDARRDVVDALAPMRQFLYDRTAKLAERWNAVRHAPGSDD